jgi:transcriptional regulator with XRE-family HTH domain
MNLGKAIREIRKRRGESQQTFAKGVGITQTSISKLESNVTRCNTGTMRKMCKYLEVPEILIRVYAMEPSDLPEGRRETLTKTYMSMRELLIEMFTP